MEVVPFARQHCCPMYAGAEHSTAGLAHLLLPVFPSHSTVIIVTCIPPQHTYEELKPGALDSCHKMMGVSLETLAQLAASFCTMYEEEVRPWCSSRDAPPPTSSLGPVCQRVALLKVEIDKVSGVYPSWLGGYRNGEFFYTHAPQTAPTVIDHTHQCMLIM